MCASVIAVWGEEPPDPAKDKAKQQESLAAALKEYNSPDKVKSLLPFLDSPYAEISTTALAALRELPAYYVFGPALDALRARTRVAREYAAEALGTAGNDDAVLPLVKVILNDPQDPVRQKALNSLLNLASRDRLISNFSEVMQQEGVGPYHIRAAGAMGYVGLGSDRAVTQLVQRLKIIRIWPAGPRVHAFFGELFTYIKDFDIVLTNAQFSWTMPDPVPSTIYSGVVLDVRITKVEEFITIEREVIMHSLGRISGNDFGQDSKRWLDWWAGENSKTLAQRYAEKKAEIAKSEAARKEGGIDAGKRLQLGVWCKNQKQEKEAVQEFTAVLAKDESDTSAATNLRDMGFAFYEDRWQEIPKVLPLGERAVHVLLNQLKTYDETKRQEASAQLAGSDAVFKFRPFIKTLQADPVPSIRAYTAEGLAGTGERNVVSYLVKASLEDESEAVRTSAFNALAKFGIRESIPWYAYFLESSPDTTALLRTTKILGEIGVGDRLAAVALLRQLFWLNSATNPEMKAANLSLPYLQALGVHQKDTLTFGSVIIELPDKKLGAPRTQGSLKMPDDILVKATAEALSKITGQNLGTDYTQWSAWWNKIQPDK